MSERSRAWVDEEQHKESIYRSFEKNSGKVLKLFKSQNSIISPVNTKIRMLLWQLVRFPLRVVVNTGWTWKSKPYIPILDKGAAVDAM